MKNKESRLIRECWQSLDRQFDPVSYHKHCGRVLDLTYAESKRHDLFRGDSISRGISLITEARYFAIKRIDEYFDLGTDAPSVELYFSIQQSCYASFALARCDETRPYVQKWHIAYAPLIHEIISWDYCYLIRTDDRRKFACKNQNQNNKEA